MAIRKNVKSAKCFGGKRTRCSSSLCFSAWASRRRHSISSIFAMLDILALKAKTVCKPDVADTVETFMSSAALCNLREFWWNHRIKKKKIKMNKSPSKCNFSFVPQLFVRNSCLWSQHSCFASLPISAFHLLTSAFSQKCNLLVWFWTLSPAFKSGSDSLRGPTWRCCLESRRRSWSPSCPSCPRWWCLTPGRCLGTTRSPGRRWARRWSCCRIHFSAAAPRPGERDCCSLKSEDNNQKFCLDFLISIPTCSFVCFAEQVFLFFFFFYTVPI